MSRLALAAALNAAWAIAACGPGVDLSGYGASAGAGGAAEGESESTAGSQAGRSRGAGRSADGSGGAGGVLLEVPQNNYTLGPAFPGTGVADAGGDTDAQGCTTLTGVVRDFKGKNEPSGHPDFEAFAGVHATKGLVAPDLGDDGKPIYISVCEAHAPASNCPSGQQTTSQADFDQWYRFAEGINLPYLVYLGFEPSQNSNVFTFDSQLYFPLDNAGWGNSGRGEDGGRHDFHFTTELHTKFLYGGGERFQFTGDDDLWVFVNGKLAIDLGGLHSALSATLDLDAAADSLGISPGNVYALELFHAERHTIGSHFRVDTTLTFVNCGFIPAEVR